MIRRLFCFRDLKIMVNLVYGVGINDRRYPSSINGKDAREYKLWHSTLERCYSPKSHKKCPTYIGCSVSENFKGYSYFHEWCQTQIGFGQEGFQLDKDLICKGNKVYSENTCLFLPKQLNTLLLASGASRGHLPVGVSVYRDKFSAQCCTGKSSKYIGYFQTIEEAFIRYKQVKEAYIKFKAEQWRQFIDPRAYAALMAYEVLITD